MSPPDPDQESSSQEWKGMIQDTPSPQASILAGQHREK